MVGRHSTVIEDATLARLQTLTAELPSLVLPGDVALFYYAGHAVQYRGGNYLLPVDFAIERPEQLPAQSLALEQLLNAMGQAGVSVVVLDACRDYPFGPLQEAFGDGLAGVATQGETLVAYATAAGETASDGAGPNSPYTGAFVAALEQPGRDLYDLFRTVRGKVREATAGRQIPWIAGSLETRLVLRPERPGAGARKSPTRCRRQSRRTIPLHTSRPRIGARSRRVPIQPISRHSSPRTRSIRSASWQLPESPTWSGMGSCRYKRSNWALIRRLPHRGEPSVSRLVTNSPPIHSIRPGWRPACRGGWSMRGKPCELVQSMSPRIRESSPDVSVRARARHRRALWRCHHLLSTGGRPRLRCGATQLGLHVPLRGGRRARSR